MKALLLLFAVLLMSACESQRIEYRHIVPPENMEAHRAWILECIEKANPKSDEEPEDWIARCYYVSKQLFGIRTKGIHTHISGTSRYWEPSE